MKLSLSLILGLGLCSIAYGEASFRIPKCSDGPQYWCGSIVNAKECKAVKHCIQTVWEKQTLPEDNDDVCSICKEMVKEARDQLLSNQTQEDIRTVFTQSCMLIPVKILVKECIKVTDEFIPELIDTLASQMNPQAVCATAQLCNNPYVDRILAENKMDRKKNEIHTDMSISASGNCQDCKNFIKDVSSTVRTHSRSDVLDHLLAICGRLSSLSDGCMALVQNNFQMIYDFLSTGLRPDEICELFGMCDRMYGQTTVVLPKTGDEPCDFCVAVVKSWRNNLVANTTREEFKMILDGICEHTGKFAQECHSLVDQYYDTMYDILISEIQPKEICAAVGLCGPNSIFNSKVPIWTSMQLKPEDHLPLLPLSPSFDKNLGLIGLDEANSYKEEIHLPKVILQRESVSVVIAGEKGVLNVDQTQSNKCMMCEFVLHFLQNVLNDKQTRDKIEHAVENVCNLFPHSISEQCQDYIDAYGDQLIQLLILEIDPASICPMLKLCPGVGLQQQQPLTGSSACVLCEFVMTEVEESLKNKSTEEHIKQVVDSVCLKFPSSIRDQCKSFVDTYIDQIIDLLVNDFTPGQVCAQLGLCPSTGALSPLPSPEQAQLPVTRHFVKKIPLLKSQSRKELNLTQSAGCVICEFIIHRLDALILNDATEKEIEHFVSAVCMLLPKTVKQDCLNFMEQYGNSIIEYFVSHVSADFICSELRLCKHHSMDLPKAEVKFPADECLVCAEVMKWVEHNEESVNTVEKILNTVCRRLPGDVAQKMCTDMADTYGAFLVDLLKELKDGKRVCQAIRRCPSPHRSRSLIGSEKCTWGPSYWCKSKAHADSCGATQHCVEKVWKDGVPAA